jgi:hypothetical protein
MSQSVKPTNEHVIVLLERVLEGIADLADRQRQIEAAIIRLASSD